MDQNEALSMITKTHTGPTIIKGDRWVCDWATCTVTTETFISGIFYTWLKIQSHSQRWPLDERRVTHMLYIHFFHILSTIRNSSTVKISPLLRVASQVYNPACDVLTCDMKRVIVIVLSLVIIESVVQFEVLVMICRSGEYQITLGGKSDEFVIATVTVHVNDWGEPAVTGETGEISIPSARNRERDKLMDE